MSDTIRATLLFIIDSVIDLYLFILIIRVVFAFIRADYAFPVTQFVVKMTNPLVKPLKAYIPTKGGIELASVALIIGLQLIKFFFISILSFGFPHLLGLLLIALTDSAKLILLTFFYAILIQAILSFIQPQSPVYRLISQFTSPILLPIQRIIPPVAGIDISPIPALIIIQALIMIMVNPLFKTGISVAFGT